MRYAIRDILNLRRVAGSILILGALMGACNDPVTYTPSKTDKFTTYNSDAYAQADMILQADYLFVMDYSFSMKYVAKQQEIAASLHLFAESLEQTDVDYQIAFIPGFIQSTGSLSQISTSFLTPFLTNANDIHQEVEDQIAGVGAPHNPNQGQLLESAFRTMTTEKDAFLRPGSQLIYIFITDDEDHSSKSNDFYIKELSRFKPDHAYISARAVIAGFDSSDGKGGTIACPFLTPNNDTFQRKAQKLHDTVPLLDSLGTDTIHCVNKPAENFLLDLARNINKTNTRFLIRGQPDPDTIRIRVKPVNGGWLTMSEGDDYSYDASTNEVIFVQGREPDFSAELEILYDQIYPLAEVPNVASIEVFLNDAAVPQSESDGWTYSSEDNRIVFHGSWRPNHEDKVKILYKPFN